MTRRPGRRRTYPSVGKRCCSRPTPAADLSIQAPARGRHRDADACVTSASIPNTRSALPAAAACARLVVRNDFGTTRRPEIVDDHLCHGAVRRYAWINPSRLFPCVCTIPHGRPHPPRCERVERRHQGRGHHALTLGSVAPAMLQDLLVNARRRRAIRPSVQPRPRSLFCGRCRSGAGSWRRRSGEILAHEASRSVARRRGRRHRGTISS